MEFVTLSKGDPEFDAYLLGTFAKDKRALPVDTFQHGQRNERVTFQIVSLNEVKAPPWWLTYLRSCRLELSTMALGPAGAAWLSHPDRYEQWTQWPSWFAMLGLFFLQTSLFLFNDYQDHLGGKDRLNRRRGSQVIQKGWTTALHMRRWAMVNGALGLMFGVPAFLNAPVELAVIGVLSFVAMFGFLKSRGQRWGQGDVSLFLLLGPLLACGVAAASYSQILVGDLLVGFAFGLLSLWVFHARQFEDLFRSRPEFFRTFLGYLPFDQARIFVLFEGVAVVTFQWLALNVVAASVHPAVYAVFACAASVPVLLTMRRFWQATSPLSSSLMRISSWALASHAVWTLAWWSILGSLWL